MSRSNAPIDDRIEAALRKVREPNAGIDVVEAGLVQDVDLDDGAATVYFDFSTVDAHTATDVADVVIRAVTDVDGVDHAHVERAVPTADGRTTGAGDFDRILAVASAKGGVGKSTVATHLACALAARGDDVALFDADIHGPNVPDLFGISGPVYSTDGGDPLPVSYGPLEVMSVGLMTEGAPLAWRGAMAHDTVSELFDETAWENTGTLVVDLPPGTGDVVLTTLQEVPVDGVAVVTTPFHSAVSDTAKTVELFRENDVPVLGTVVNMAGFTCENCNHDHDLFPGESPVETLETPPLGQLPFTQELQGSPEPTADGVPDAVDDLASAVESRYDDVWSVDVPDDAVDLRGMPADERRDAVADGFAACESGERFVVVSDRDPTPVRDYLADVHGASLERVETRQPNPETWLFRTTRP
ncbi:MAG: P-loop NTPase [Haloferacaceae archaeon]